MTTMTKDVIAHARAQAVAFLAMSEEDLRIKRAVAPRQARRLLTLAKDFFRDESDDPEEFGWGLNFGQIAELEKEVLNCDSAARKMLRMDYWWRFAVRHAREATAVVYVAAVLEDSPDAFGLERLQQILDNLHDA